jgi:3',5'-cyclic AMP phosphodiesterase CpdA
MRSGEPCSHHKLDRRSFLGMAGASAATAGLATLLGAAPATAAQAGPDRAGADTGAPLRFAVVADTHVNVTSPQSTTWLGEVYAAIARRGPDFVLHCGDITDTGLPDEYAQYAQTLPPSLLGKIHYSPGNHDVRWDATAKELYHAHFGPAPQSFDAGGMHFIGFDPTEVLQEPGHYGPGGLRWLGDDLRSMAPGRPAVLFQHFPMGNDNYYVDDQPAVLDLAASYDVRGFFAGHIHREVVTKFNGLTAAPGQQRLQVQVTASDGTWWEDVTLFGMPATAADPVPRWQRHLAGPVQGGIALAGSSGDVLVAATSSGQIAAYRNADRRQATSLWQAQIGPVYRRPGVTADGRTFVRAVCRPSPLRAGYRDRTGTVAFQCWGSAARRASGRRSGRR